MTEQNIPGNSIHYWYLFRKEEGRKYQDEARTVFSVIDEFMFGVGDPVLMFPLLLLPATAVFWFIFRRSAQAYIEPEARI